jgi:hypothetical protein
MDTPTPRADPAAVDERFFHDWVAFGMLELAVYLTRHAEFAAYCVERELRRAGTRGRRAA